MPRAVTNTLELALLCAVVACGQPIAPASPCPGTELTAPQCTQLRTLALPAQLPSAWGNSHGDELAAAKLGFAIFFDARFSSTEDVRCASCHQPERMFCDALVTPKALGPVPRNSPSLVNVARQRTQMWDGRADSLWSQPLWAFENPNEMNFSRLELAHQLAALRKADYEAVFGALPPLDDPRFPPKGKPGTAEWEAMSVDDQQAIDGVAANIGKAIEAYERKLAGTPSPVDRWLGGDLGALKPDELRGLGVLVRAGCLQCHSGPNLTDEGFHNLGVPAATGAPLDRGHEEGLELLATSALNMNGAFWEGARPEPQSAPSTQSQLGAIKTPSLRNLGRTAPFGHNGTFSTLEQIVDFHLEGGGRAANGFVGEVDPLLVPVTLTPANRDALLAALRAFTGPRPSLPWGDWPQH